MQRLTFIAASLLLFLGPVVVLTCHPTRRPHVPPVIPPRDPLRSKYCLPGEDCWPGLEEITRLNDSLHGTVVLPINPIYHMQSPVNSQYHRKYPAVIVKVLSIADVQMVLQFTRTYNIRLAIYSTGHEYNGRSTAHGSLQLSMVHMDRIDINPSDGASDTGASATVQTGNNWGRIYQAINEVGKIIVGGEISTVGPGGFTAGGGHSPLARSFGLAVDNCIGATIVLTDGNVAFLNSSGRTIRTPSGHTYVSADTDLFWAVRGGGGGTFGIIIDYTFKLHDPPSQLVQYTAMYPMDINGNATFGRQLIDYLHQLLPHLPTEWGGHFVYAVPPAASPTSMSGIIMIDLLHFGPWSKPSMRAIDSVINFHPEVRFMSKFTNYSSFWEFQQTVTSDTSYRGYIANSLIPRHKLTPDLAQFYVDYIQDAPRDLNGKFILCAEVLIGGKVAEFDDGSTSVSHGFRQALLSAVCFLSWDGPRMDSVGMELAKAMSERFYEHSEGVYLNEPAYHLPNWRNDFWGTKYGKLLSLKRKWDPDNALYCRHCIGDDSD